MKRARVLALVLAGLLGMVALSSWIATRAVHFVGTDERGFVTVFQGVPYELPGFPLYDEIYTSGVPASSLRGDDRDGVLTHDWRSREDAFRAVRGLERERLYRRTQS